jgi:hypothetical protein
MRAVVRNNKSGTFDNQRVTPVVDAAFEAGATADRLWKATHDAGSRFPAVCNTEHSTEAIEMERP